MSRSKKIILFTFWMNNIEIPLFAIFIFGLIFSKNKGLMAAMLALLLAVLLIVVIQFELWYLRDRLNVYKVRSIFCFTDDEREKEIAMKVHSEMMISFINGFFGSVILMVGAWLFNLSAISIITCFTVLWVIYGVGINIQYLYLWNKFDNVK